MSRNIRRVRRSANQYMENPPYTATGDGVSTFNMGNGNQFQSRCVNGRTVQTYMGNNSSTLAQRLGLMEAGMITLADSAINQNSRITNLERILGVDTPVVNTLNTLNTLDNIAANNICTNRGTDPALVLANNNPTATLASMNAVNNLNTVNNLNVNQTRTALRNTLPIMNRVAIPPNKNNLVANQLIVNNNWWDAIGTWWNNYDLPSHPINLNNGSNWWQTFSNWWLNANSPTFPTNFANADTWWLALNSWWNDPNNINSPVNLPGSNVWWSIIQAWWRMIISVLTGSGTNAWNWNDAQIWWNNQTRYWGPNQGIWNNMAQNWWRSQSTNWWGNNGIRRVWNNNRSWWNNVKCNPWWNNNQSWWNDNNWCNDNWNYNWSPCSTGCSRYEPCDYCYSSRCWDRGYWNTHHRCHNNCNSCGTRGRREYFREYNDCCDSDYDDRGYFNNCCEKKNIDSEKRYHQTIDFNRPLSNNLCRDEEDHYFQKQFDSQFPDKHVNHADEYEHCRTIINNDSCEKEYCEDECKDDCKKNVPMITVTFPAKKCKPKKSKSKKKKSKIDECCLEEYDRPFENVNFETRSENNDYGFLNRSDDKTYEYESYPENRKIVNREDDILEFNYDNNLELNKNDKLELKREEEEEIYFGNKNIHADPSDSETEDVLDKQDESEYLINVDDTMIDNFTGNIHADQDFDDNFNQIHTKQFEYPVQNPMINQTPINNYWQSYYDQSQFTTKETKPIQETPIEDMLEQEYYGWTDLVDGFPDGVQIINEENLDKTLQTELSDKDNMKCILASPKTICALGSPETIYTQSATINSGVDTTLIVQPAGVNNINARALWANSLSSESISSATTITVDTMDNIIVIGNFIGKNKIFINKSKETNQSTGTDCIQIINPSMNIDLTNNAVVSKFSSGGNLLWHSKITSNGPLNAFLSKVSQNDIIVVGTFTSPLNIYDKDEQIITSISNIGTVNTFIIKYKSNGDIIWATAIVGDKIIPGNVSSIIATGLDVNELGEIYVCGYIVPTNGATDFLNNNGFLGKQLASNIVPVSFLVKYSSAGTVLWINRITDVFIAANKKYGVSVSSTKDAVILTTFVNSLGQIYDGPDGINLSTNQMVSHEDEGLNLCVVKYNTSGISEWVTNITGFTENNGNGIQIDKYSDYAAVILVPFQKSVLKIYNTPNGSVDSNITLTNSTTDNITSDLAIIKYNTDGTARWTTQISGNINPVSSQNIIIDNNSNISICGSVSSGEVIIYSVNKETKTILQEPASSFIVKFDLVGKIIWAAKQFSTTGIVENNEISLTTDGVVISGTYSNGPFIFNNSDGSSGLTLPKNYTKGIFIGKYINYAQVLKLEPGICQEKIKSITISGYSGTNTLIEIPESLLVEDTNGKRIKGIVLTNNAACLTIKWIANKWVVIYGRDTIYFF